MHPGSIRSDYSSGYPNQKLIVQNQEKILANQETIKKNQATLETIVRNQEIILALLQK